MYSSANANIQGFSAGGDFDMLGGKARRGRKPRRHGGGVFYEDNTMTKEEIDARMEELKVVIPKPSSDAALTVTDAASDATPTVPEAPVGGKKHRKKSGGLAELSELVGGKRRAKKHGGMAELSEVVGGKKKRTGRKRGGDCAETPDDPECQEEFATASPGAPAVAAAPAAAPVAPPAASPGMTGGKKKRAVRKHRGGSELEQELSEQEGGKKKRSARGRKHGGDPSAELAALTAKLQHMLGGR